MRVGTITQARTCSIRVKVARPNANCTLLCVRFSASNVPLQSYWASSGTDWCRARHRALRLTNQDTTQPPRLCCWDTLLPPACGRILSAAAARRKHPGVCYSLMAQIYGLNFYSRRTQLYALSRHTISLSPSCFLLNSLSPHHSSSLLEFVNRLHWEAV